MFYQHFSNKFFVRFFLKDAELIDEILVSLTIRKYDPLNQF